MNVVTSINRMRLSSLVRIVVVYVYIMQTVKDELFDLSVHVQFFLFLFLIFPQTHLLNSWCLMGWTMHRKMTIIESINIKDGGQEDWAVHRCLPRGYLRLSEAQRRQRV